MGAASVPMFTLTSAGSVRSTATTADRITPLTGTRLALSLDHRREPGTAPSRLKANSMRVVEVMQAVVQKNWPAVEISRTTPAHLLDSAWLKIVATAPPPLVTPASSCTAKRNVSRRTQPPMAEYAIDC